jgi:hypothetical protein
VVTIAVLVVLGAIAALAVTTGVAVLIGAVALLLLALAAVVGEVMRLASDDEPSTNPGGAPRPY